VSEGHGRAFTTHRTNSDTSACKTAVNTTSSFHVTGNILIKQHNK